MDTSVALRPMASLSPEILIAGIIGFAISLAIIVLIVLKNRNTQPDKQPMVINPVSDDIRSTYERRLRKLASQLDRSEIDARSCAEQASLCIREFAGKATGQDHSSLTLSEIEKASGVKGLDSAISKCYESEFPREPKGRAMDAVQACLEVIRIWH